MHDARSLRTITLVLLLTNGCAPSLKVDEPRLIASRSWSDQSADANLAQGRLSELLNSPELATLTAQALEYNTEILIGRARVAQSHALLRAVRQSALPEISIAAGASRRFEGNGGNPFDFSGAFTSLDVNLDLDLFGRLGSEKQAAVSRSRAAELQRDAIALAVETEVATAYVQRAATAKRIAILDFNIERAIELDRVIRVRSSEGAATRVDQGLQSIRLLNLREEASRLRQALDRTRTALAILTGSEAPRFSVSAANLDAITIPQLGTPPPSELLAARPDVQASEALILAAKGDVAQARAAFFPQIGVSIQALLELVTANPLGKSLSFGSSLLAPIFSRGRLEGDFQLASALELEVVERYRGTILAALAEVEDARSAGQRSVERAKLLDAVVEEARLTAHLANLQYLEGEDDVQNVLDAETFLSEAEDARVVGWQERLYAQISLYRAMGGYPVNITK